MEERTGRRSGVGRRRVKFALVDNVLKEQVLIKRAEIPKGWSIEAADFINKVITIYKYLTVISLSAYSASQPTALD